MRIVTDGNDWVCLGEWYGQEAVLFRGSIFGCITFRAENS